MKYAITHCYSDKNKGDLAIILSTIQLLKKVDPSSEIHCFSTYGSTDLQFRQNHSFLEKFCDHLHPAIFPQPTKINFIPWDWLRITSFLLSLFKNLMVIVAPSPIIMRLVLRKEVYTGLSHFRSCDIVIAKGGSYLTTQNRGIRQSLSLINMLFPFWLARRFKRPCVIFSQSLGPIEGHLNSYMFANAMKFVDRVFLREDLCLRKYEAVRQACAARYEVVPDTAFYLELPKGHQSEYRQTNYKAQLRVGLTVVDHSFKYISCSETRALLKKQYEQVLVKALQLLISKYSAEIVIFPQVTISDSNLGLNDLYLGRRIFNTLQSTTNHSCITFLDHDYSPFELRSMYREMDIFVGTRLHSVIFAMSEGVPSLNISYHGTKSNGIFEKYFPDLDCVLDIDSLAEDRLIDRIEWLIANRMSVTYQVKAKVSLMKSDLERAMEQVRQIALTHQSANSVAQNRPETAKARGLPAGSNAK